MFLMEKINTWYDVKIEFESQYTYDIILYLLYS